MSILPSLPKSYGLVDVFSTFRQNSGALLEYQDQLLRGESPLSIADRELIAAFVSALNSCDFCFGIHSQIATAYGVELPVLDAIIEDIDAAPINEKLIPLLHYMKKLTLSPAKISALDAQSVYQVGWSELALHDAVAVCSMFNFMNRFVEGLGVTPAALVAHSQTLTSDHPPTDNHDYRNFGKMIGVIET